MEKTGQYRIAEKIAGKVIGVSGAVSLCVAFHTLPVSGEIIVGLRYAGNYCGKCKRPRISDTLKEQLELLARTQRKCIVILGGVKCRHHTQYSLFFLLF